MCACVSDWTNVFNFGIGGSVYLYQAKEKSHNDDWRQDGYRWVNQGTTGLPRKNPKVKKSCFYSATPQGHNKDFKRAGYFLATDNSDCKKYVIQYLGDHKIAQEYPHGNSKQTKNFIPTKKSVLSKIEQRVESEIPQKVYKSLVTETPTPDTNDNEEITTKPRNTTQVSNMRKKVLESQRISNDAIVNIHDICRELHPNIWPFITMQDILIPIGHQELIEELTSSCMSSMITKVISSHMTPHSIWAIYMFPLYFFATLASRKDQHFQSPFSSTAGNVKKTITILWKSWAKESNTWRANL